MSGARLEVRAAGRPLAGRYCPPGDKSISHRLAILGGLADGETRVTGYLDSADTLATLQAMETLGAAVRREDDAILIRGGRLRATSTALDLGNSGTGMRLLCGALAGRPELRGERLQLIGDESLSRRPMGRISDPLASMGARIETVDGHAPLTIWPAPLTGIRYRMPVASAQIKSALLLAGLAAEGDTVVLEPGPSRDHSERLLPAFGVEVERLDEGVRLRGGQALHGAGPCRVPGDLSSAAFAVAAALLVPGSSLTLDNVGLNPSRDGILRIIAAMGGEIEREPSSAVGGEPVGSLRLRAQRLRGIDVPEAWVGLAIDEFPVLMALAACAEGTTRISGAGELRVKESDRLAVMCSQLRRLGVQVEETADGAIIEGGRVQSGQVDSHGDHRIAMSLAVLGLVAEGPVSIANAEWIRTSYPGFVDDMRALGGDMAWA